MKQNFVDYKQDAMKVFRTSSAHHAAISRRQRINLEKQAPMAIGDPNLTDEERKKKCKEYAQVHIEFFGDGVVTYLLTKI